MGRGCAGVVIDRARNGLGTQTFEIWNDGPLDQDLLKLQKLDAVIRDGVYGTEHPPDTEGCRATAGMNRICSWIAGARRSMPMT